MFRTLYRYATNLLTLITLVVVTFTNAQAASIDTPEMTSETMYVITRNESPALNENLNIAGISPAQQQQAALAGECVVSNSSQLTSALTNTTCSTVIALPGNYAGYYQLKRNSFTLRCSENRQCKAYEIDLYGDGITLDGWTLSSKEHKVGIRNYGDNNFILNNETYKMGEDCWWIFGSNLTVRGNYCHDIYDPTLPQYPEFDQHVDCFQTWAWYSPGTIDAVNNILFENNICDHNRASGSNQLFIMTHTDSRVPIKNIVIKNNIFIANDSGYVPLAFYGDSSNTGMVVEGNTFYNRSKSGSNPVYIEGPSVTVRNNVSYGYTGSFVRGGAIEQSNNQMFPFSSVPGTLNFGTATPIVVPSNTPTKALSTATQTATATFTKTSTSSPVPSRTPTATYTATFTPSFTPTKTATATFTASPSPTPTFTATSTPEPTFTSTQVPATNTNLPALTQQPEMPTATSTEIISPEVPTEAPTTEPTSTTVDPVPSAVPTETATQENVPTIAPTATETLPTETPTEANVITPSPMPTQVATAEKTPLPATPTSVPPQSSQKENKFDNDDPAFVYSSGWKNMFNKQAYKGKFKQTAQRNSEVKFTFTGEDFTILYTAGQFYGKVDVYIDGVKVDSFSQKAKRVLYKQTWEYQGTLPNGQHELRLVFTGPKNTLASIDGVIVYQP